MEITEFKDGYCLSHKGKDYNYQGKSEDAIKMISLKVQQLLLDDRNILIKNVLKENHIN